MNARPRVVFMGTPSFAVPILEGLAEDGYPITAVVTQPDRPSGRKGTPIASPVKQKALELGLPVLQPQRMRDPAFLDQLRSFQPDVIVVAAFGKILPREVLSLPPHSCLNVHASLLPKYRGASPISAAILAGEPVTGVTVMLINESLDSGDVLAQRQVAVAPTDTTEALSQKLAAVGRELLLEVLPRWVAGEIVPRPQIHSEATFTTVLAKQEGSIDWTRPAVEIERQVRAYYPWPSAYTYWDGQQLRILRAKVRKEIEEGIVPGRAAVLPRLESEGTDLVVATGDGYLVVLEGQLAGKKAMGAEEFLRGHRRIVGAVLGSPTSP
jgi:methionyl-tRNA formyltransferase